MIDPYLVERMMPYIKMDIPREKWKYIPEILREAYLVDYGNERVISLKPVPTDVDEARNISLQYNAITGASAGIDFWNIAKKKGKQL